MENRQLPEDFKDFIHCLNSNNVKYLLLGGWAVGIHGHPRFTKDIDFLISIDNSNLENLKKAFDGFLAPKFDIDYLKVKGNGIKIGAAPIAIDIINDADGIDFEDCYSRREIVSRVYCFCKIGLVQRIVPGLSTGCFLCPQYCGEFSFYCAFFKNVV